MLLVVVKVEDLLEYVHVDYFLLEAGVSALNDVVIKMCAHHTR